jgi:hypothetical protein
VPVVLNHLLALIFQPLTLKLLLELSFEPLTLKLLVVLKLLPSMVVPKLLQVLNLHLQKNSFFFLKKKKKSSFLLVKLFVFLGYFSIEWCKIFPEW